MPTASASSASAQLPTVQQTQGILVGLSFAPAQPSITLDVEGKPVLFPASSELVEHALRFRGQPVRVVVLLHTTPRLLSIHSLDEVPPEERDADHRARWSEVLKRLA